MTDGWSLFDAAEEVVLRVEVEGGEAVALSWRGPGKQVNEDAAAVLPCLGGVLLLVCDGMGGHLAGERASRASIEAIAARFAAASVEQMPRHTLIDGIEEANRAVLALGIGAGATLAAVVVRDGRARSAHVGDAAVMHFGGRGKMKAQTLSHSPTGYAVEAGMLDEDEALHHEERHLVSNHVGMEEMRVDLGPELAVAPRDTLLLASDGLIDNLWTDEVVELGRKGDLEQAARSLARLARERMLVAEEGMPSKPDDLTLVLFRRRARSDTS